MALQKSEAETITASTKFPADSFSNSSEFADDIRSWVDASRKQLIAEGVDPDSIHCKLRVTGYKPKKAGR